MKKIDNVIEAKKFINDWCSEFGRKPLEIDEIDDTHLCLEFKMKDNLGWTELTSLTSRFYESFILLKKGRIVIFLGYVDMSNN